MHSGILELNFCYILFYKKLKQFIYVIKLFYGENHITEGHVLVIER